MGGNLTGAANTARRPINTRFRVVVWEAKGVRYLMFTNKFKTDNTAWSAQANKAVCGRPRGPRPMASLRLSAAGEKVERVVLISVTHALLRLAHRA